MKFVIEREVLVYYVEKIALLLVHLFLHGEQQKHIPYKKRDKILLILSINTNEMSIIAKTLAFFLSILPC